MSILGDVFGSLKAMSLLQLLLAFVACIGYLLAQGRLVTPRGRAATAALAASATLAFVLLGTSWVHSLMLVAFAVAGLGAFIAIAWLSARLLGFAVPAPTLPAHSAHSAHSIHGDDSGLPGPDAMPAPQALPPRPQRAPMAPT